MEIAQYQIEMENRQLEEDRKQFKMELATQQNKYSVMLNGEMGEDIKNVLNGKVKVDLPKKQRIMFKIKCFFNNIFNKL